MKKTFILLMSFILAVGFFAPAFAQPRDNTKVTIDLADLDSLTRDKVIELMKKSNVTGTISLKDLSPDNIRTWVSSISAGIKDVCHELNIAVNDFITTPAGMIITGTLVYSLIGKQIFIGLKDTFFGVVGWVVSMLILFFLARKFILPRKVKTQREYEGEVGGKTRKIKQTTYEFITPYEFRTSESRSAAFTLIIVPAVIFTFAAMIIVL